LYLWRFTRVSEKVADSKYCLQRWRFSRLNVMIVLTYFLCRDILQRGVI